MPTVLPDDLTVRQLRELYSRGEVTPMDAADDALHRVEADPGLRAFAHVRADEARDEARAATARLARGAPLSPLDGVPVAVKSMVALAGLPQDAGSRVLQGRRAGRDATLVGALKQAGAVIVGTTTMDEFALTTLGPARNPFDRTRTTACASACRPRSTWASPTRTCWRTSAPPSPPPPTRARRSSGWSCRTRSG
ncbi:amidase family protein [Actinomadura syzygii]|uniref:amidase family protein n=1 Tax=Actinomadura syzygii TaxID=1427538 RepID=UPI001FEA27E4|nr:amidase family protein [Actinomadura syzygii]